MDHKDKTDRLTYAASGVDIDAGERAVELIKSVVAGTFNEQVLTGLGAFGGFFRPDFESLERPVLVSSTDSVGTKVKIAFMANRHDTIGEDLVNHCVNDILVHGARPLFFLDYLGLGKVNPETVARMVSGLARGCKANGAALIGGETAELTDLYAPGEYDIAGFIVGMVEQSKIINGSTIEPGDVCLGLSSNGLHTNGYTLARKVVFDVGGLDIDSHIEELGETVFEALMKVHRTYLPIIRPLLDKFEIHGMAHITGGGIAGNLSRILPNNCRAEIQKESWPVLPLFQWLERLGNLDPNDIYRSFNMGIGYILVVPPKQADEIESCIRGTGEEVFRLGEIVEGKKEVRLID